MGNAGPEPAYELSDLIYTDPESLAMLVDRIVRLRKPLFLARLPADSPTIREFQRACRGRALVRVTPSRMPLHHAGQKLA